MTSVARLDELAAEVAAAAAGPGRDLAPRIVEVLGRLKAEPVVAEEVQRRINLLIEAGFSLYAHGGSSVPLALEPITAAELLAADFRSLPQLRRALSVKGVVLSQLRHTAAALETLERALQVAEELGDSFGMAAAWTNMGMVFSEVGLASDAESCVNMARTQMKTIGPSALRDELLLAVIHLTAGCRYAAGEAETSLKLCDQALSLLAEFSIGGVDANAIAARQRGALFHALAAECLIDLHRFKDAALRATKAKEAAGSSGAERALVSAECVSCLVDACATDPIKGITQLEALRARAESSAGSYIEYLSICVKAYEATGLANAALRCYQELVRVLRRSQSEAILHSAGRNTSAAETSEAGSSRELIHTALAERVREILSRSRFSLAKL